MMTLRDVLKNSGELDSGDFLYLPFDRRWGLDTQCAILAESDLDEVPVDAQSHGLAYAVGVATVQEVVANAKAQDNQISDDRLLEAFLFYYDHDAFIAFDQCR